MSVGATKSDGVSWGKVSRFNRDAMGTPRMLHVVHDAHLQQLGDQQLKWAARARHVTGMNAGYLIVSDPLIILLQCLVPQCLTLPHYTRRFHIPHL